jgi:MFS family permease
VYVSVRDRPAGGPVSSGPTIGRRVATTVLLLGAVSLLTDVSSEMVNAILPLYLTSQVGLSLAAYGVVDGVYQGTSAVVRISGGYAADRWGRPKWVATIGYGVSALSRVAMLPAHGFAAITSVITADRLGKGLRTAPRDALIVEASDPSTLGRAFGVHRALDTAGAALGPLLAFALLFAAPGRYDSVFVVSFGFAIVGLAVITLFVADRRTTGATRMTTVQLLRAMAAPRLRRPLLGSALLGLVTVGDGFLYLALQQRGQFASMMFPLFYVGTNLVYLALAVPIGRLADRIGRGRALIAGHVALLAAYLAVAAPWAGTAWTMVSLLLLGLFYAATDGVLPALIGGLVAPEVRGSGIAAAQTGVALARFAASVGFGALWAALGRGPAFLLMGLALVVVIPVAAWLLAATGRRAVGVPA